MSSLSTATPSIEEDITVSDDNIPVPSVKETWIPIYVTLILSVGQILALLIVFECSRRSKQVGDVYDRRRLVWPNRVPPPLMQRRGLLWGYLGWEWYRLKCSDPEYCKQAIEEHRQRMKEEQTPTQTQDKPLNGSEQRQSQNQQNQQRRSSIQSVHNRRTRTTSNTAVDTFLIEAEQQCLEEAPFYFPDGDDSLSTSVEEAGIQLASPSQASPNYSEELSRVRDRVQARRYLSDEESDVQEDLEANNVRGDGDGDGDGDGNNRKSNDAGETFSDGGNQESFHDDNRLEDLQITFPSSSYTNDEVTSKSKADMLMDGLRMAPLLVEDDNAVDDCQATEPDDRNVHTKSTATDPAPPTEITSASISFAEENDSSTVPAGGYARGSKPMLVSRTSTETSEDPSGKKSSILKAKTQSFGTYTTTKTTDTGTTSSSPQIPFRSPIRRVRFLGRKDPALSPRTDAGAKSIKSRQSAVGSSQPKELTFGTKEAEAQAGTRYYIEDREDWDVAAIATISGWISNFLKKRVFKISQMEQQQQQQQQQQQASQEFGTTNTPNKKGRPKMVSRNVSRRPLSKEQAEVLRCIGLDSFVMLQFLQFGFAVSFWPVLFACLVLLPTYRTGSGGEVGFFTVTVSNIADDSNKLWLVVIYGYIQVIFILRRLWVEWEIFLPLRNDFLERGDFIHSKYQDQYRKTCLVEYIPKSHRHDETLYEFFDALFPGQVHRTEVLLNTERLRDLIKKRLHHIQAYENGYAMKVHKRAKYLREIDACRKGNIIRRGCRKIVTPRKPKEKKIIVKEHVPGMDLNNFFLTQNEMVMEPHTYEELQYHKREVSRLNKEIEDEFIRLALKKRQKVQKQHESLISKWLGLKYIWPKDDGRVHSCTAFVEFSSLTAKQQAIQCNLTGASALMAIFPVPEVRAILWENVHVSKRLIDRRRIYANVALIGVLILWSIIVATIRSYQDLSERLSDYEVARIPLVATILDNYLPALIVEGVVRGIAFLLRFIAKWIRLKTISEIDTYVLKWYFGFRLLTFVFVIVGGSLVESGESFVDDPLGFIKSVSQHATDESVFFITYVMVAGGLQVFFRLSQVHNVIGFWFTKKVTTEEALSQRRLHEMRSQIKKFHLDEFIPLFLFVFMVSALYGWIAPLSNVVVAIFFKCAYKVFKYMTLYIYGNSYEGGGFLFYTLTEMIFLLLYGLIVLLAGYFSVFGNAAMAGVFSILLFVTYGVQLGINKTFQEPSQTLGLTKALEFDSNKLDKDRALKMYLRARAFLEKYDHIDDNSKNYGDEVRRLMPTTSSHSSRDQGDISDTGHTPQSHSMEQIHNVEAAVAKFERRYKDTDSMSELTGDTEDGPARDFFIYRQPSLNRATWETAPRPYWESNEDTYDHASFWR